MEVHPHHHTHGKKKFKEYLLEFLMLFLAVTLGFLAENFREHLTERKKEKEYIASYISDLAKDTAYVNQASKMLFDNLHHGDSLIYLLQHYTDNDSVNKKCYRHYLLGGVKLVLMSFNQSTYAQLLSTGGMQLISRRNITDSIMAYGALTKAAENQGAYYKAEFDKSFDFSANIFDFSIIHVRVDTDYTLHPVPGFNTEHFKLVNNDPATLQKYSSCLIMQSTLSASYLFLLRYTKETATRLIKLLRSKYDL